MSITINFTLEDLEVLRKKFKIDNEEDLYDAIMECINTYLEM